MSGTGISFMDDFEEEHGFKTFEELKASLGKAVQSSPKSMVTARYPRNNYDIADFRLNVQANLEAIRKNPNNTKAIKILMDVVMADGSYFSEYMPDYAALEMSYNQFDRLSYISFIKNVLKPMVAKLEDWETSQASGNDSDPFNAFDGVPDDTLANPEPEFDEIKGLLERGQKIEAIQAYRAITGAGLAEAKVAIERYAADNGITAIPNSTQSTPVKYENSALNSGSNNAGNTEKYIKFLGDLSVTPFTFLAGIFVLCLIGKAKEENGGELSEVAQRGVKKGLWSFFIYTAIFLLLILISL